MGLFDPVWMTTDISKKAKALDKVKKLVREDQLAKAALNAPLESVRIEAVDRLKDQSSLFKAAVSDKSRKVREHAVLRIEDQSMLKEIALSDDTEAPCSIAANRITDQLWFEKTALKDSHPGQYDPVQLTAISKVKSQDVLRQLAQSNNKYVRSEVASVIKDDEVLREMAYKDPEKTVRLKAAERLGLTDILEAERMNVRIKNLIKAPWNKPYKNAKAELDSISDRSALAEIYSFAEKQDIRDLALKRLISITPAEADLADFLLNNKMRSSTDAYKVCSAIRSPFVLLDLIRRSDLKTPSGRETAKTALEKLNGYPDMLYEVYDAFENNKALSERAWELLVLRHKSFLEEMGLKKEADEAEKKIKEKYEAARQELDEAADRIPPD